MTVEQIQFSIQRNDDFLKSIDYLYPEFELFKLETDLTHIQVDGYNLSVHKISFLDWFKWRIQSELDEVTEEITEDAQFEEITIC